MSAPVAAAYRGRFAPSPTGPLHFGSLLSAWASWLDARQHGGTWLLRIENLDPPREVAGAARQQLATLHRFGLVEDEPVLWQSQRGALYDAALAELARRGHSFACSCSRKQLAAHGGVHRRCVATLDPRRQAIRLRIAEGRECFDDRVYGRVCDDPGREGGDAVLRRADGLYAYQLAVVVDDAAQGITDIVRGADLLTSTTRQRVLQRALDLPHPRTLHLPLALDAAGHKLSKSQGAADLDREDPLAVLRAAWRHLGQDPAVLAGIRRLVELHVAAQQHWTVARIPPTPPPQATQNVMDAV
jgi:glutamyl-Q tRNA(Asp) synthetase